MIARFSLAALLAVVVAMSRPVATGGSHDLLAVGVRVQHGDTASLQLMVPTHEAQEAFAALLRTPHSRAILQGQPITLSRPAPDATDAADTDAADTDAADTETDTDTIVELIWYGFRSRAGRAAVRFVPATEEAPATAASTAMWEVAESLARATAPVTAKASRVLLATNDMQAFEEAFEALLATAPDQASTEALRYAARPVTPDATGDRTARRIVAVRVLHRLGGAAVYPDTFALLRDDPDEQVAAAVR